MTTTPFPHHPHHPSYPDPGPFTVRSVEDVLALVLLGLGFHPRDSLVLLALTAGGASFQARVDLPHDAADIPLSVGPLVDAAVRNRSQAAFVLAYSDSADDLLAHLSADSLAERFDIAGIDVLGVVQVGAGWYVDLTDPDGSAQQTSFDLSDHPLLLEAAFDGRVPHATREALAASIRPGTAQSERDRRARLEAECARRAERLDRTRSQLAFEAEWVRRAVRRAVVGRPLGEPEVARLLVALTDSDVRDVAWVGVSREDALAHVELWTSVVRQAPDEYVAAPAALLAFAAWLSGNGSLAWCAVDRCREVDDGYSLALLVSAALETAVPPTEWVPVDPRTLPLLSDPLAG